MRFIQTPPATEVRRRLPRLLVGLVTCGIGLALIIRADLGLDSWDVLHQGLSEQTGISIGLVSILIGFALFAISLPLGEQIGLGTLLNVLLIGTTIDLTLWVLDEPSSAAVQWLFLIGGTMAFAVGSGFYIGAGLGPGPRDSVMTSLARRGLRIGYVRTGIEVMVLILGWLLGGSVGVGTLVFALTIGPLVAFFLPRLSLAPVGPTTLEAY
ncbi:MAG TPA: hypothetical protein VID94_06910 [Acidimicrobiales bacterium]